MSRSSSEVVCRIFCRIFKSKSNMWIGREVSHGPLLWALFYFCRCIQMYVIVALCSGWIPADAAWHVAALSDVTHLDIWEKEGQLNMLSSVSCNYTQVWVHAKLLQDPKLHCWPSLGLRAAVHRGWRKDRCHLKQPMQTLHFCRGGSLLDRQVKNKCRVWLN